MTPDRPATLRDLAEGAVRNQVDGVLAWCNHCHHNQVLPLALLLARLGPQQPVPLVGRHLVCSACGSKDIDTRPAWRGLGEVAGHTPEPEREGPPTLEPAGAPPKGRRRRR